jgi:hypothetical protein
LRDIYPAMKGSKNAMKKLCKHAKDTDDIVLAAEAKAISYAINNPNSLLDILIFLP